MSYSVQLVAASAQHTRSCALSWTAGRSFASVYAVRAWLWAHRINLASLLEEGESSLFAGVMNGSPRPAHTFEIRCVWPHNITEITSTKTTRRTR